ncbi:hypothetical protein [Ensifer soli]|uniref:hypothetical protein n=1 Tax=Ciceribacter sp. sgz301302 TaxID=3342379 RepID=UPI0035B937AD
MQAIVSFLAGLTRRFRLRVLEKKVRLFRQRNGIRDRAGHGRLIEEIDAAIQRSPRDRKALLLMKSELHQGAGQFVEAFDLAHQAFRIDPAHARDVFQRVLKIVTALSNAKTGWGAVAFDEKRGHSSLQDFLRSIGPRIEAMRKAAPGDPVLRNARRSRLAQMGDLDQLVAFDERNLERRRTPEFMANLIDSCLKSYAKTKSLDPLARALDVAEVLGRRTVIQPRHVGQGLLAAAVASQNGVIGAISARRGRPPARLDALYATLPGLIACRAVEVQKPLWTMVYEGDEALKRRAVADRLASPELSILKLGDSVRAALIKASMTRHFWTPDGRREVVDTLSASLPKRGGTAPQRLARASLFAQGGHWEEAAAELRAAETERGWTPAFDVLLSGRHSFLPEALRTAPVFDEAASPFGDGAVALELHGATKGIGDGPTLLACADPKYFARFADTYLRTLRRQGCRLPVHFHIVNPTPQTFALHETLAREFGALSLSVERLEVKKTTYYACVRFLRAPAFLSMLGTDILLSDIDTRFSRDPMPFFADGRVKAADAVLRYYDKMRVTVAVDRNELCYRYPRILPWHHVNAACLLLKNTAGGRRMAELIRAEMARHLDAVMARPGSGWWADQNALLAVYLTARREHPEIRIANVEEVGMPFGAFAPAASAEAAAPLGENLAIFGGPGT